jgi:hypothetical protein
VLPAGYTLHPETGRAVCSDEHDGYYVTDLTNAVPEPRVAA